MNFSITTCLKKSEYIKVMFIGLYKKPYYIIITIFGLSLLTISILNYLNTISFEVYSPVIDAILGLLFLMFPALIVLISISQLNSNSSLLNEMTYTFSEVGITVIGLTFKSEVTWSHIIKWKEIGNFLILYHTKKFGNFIDKSRLTPEQLTFIKGKVVAK